LQIACKEVNFSSGDGAQRQPVKKTPDPYTPTPQIDPQPPVPPTTQYPTPQIPPGPILPNPMPQIPQQQPCNPASYVMDPNVSQPMGGRRDLVNLVNAVCGPKLSNNFYGAGAIHSDQTMADVLCRFSGFQKGIITKTGKYSSPGDNFVGTWVGSAPNLMGPFDPLSGELRVASARTANSLMDGLTCVGRVRPECVPKAQLVNCR
jgi:hypothetical protein